MRKLFLVVSAIAAVALAAPAVAAAGSPPKKPPPVDLEGKVNSHGTKTVKQRSIDVEQDDFYFEPTFIRAKPGSTVRVKLENEGNASHTFTIDAEDVDKVVSAGKDATVKVTVPDSGFVAFYCRFHDGQGMQGAVFTKAGESSSSNGTSETRSPSTSGGGPYGY